MEAMVAEAFLHRNTGKIWHKGDVFVGSSSEVSQLEASGFLVPLAAHVALDAPELASMTVRELMGICADMGIKLAGKPRKADLIAAIEGAR